MTVEDLVAFLRACLDEDEWWAHEASRRDNHYTASGEHWRWECCEDDEVIEADPVAGEMLEHDGHWRVALRSREEYPTDSVGPLPHFVVPHAEEVPAVPAGHIARHDPARVLREVEAKRRIIDRIVPAIEAAESEVRAQYDWSVELGQGTALLRLLALPYADHEEFRPEWRP